MNADKKETSFRAIVSPQDWQRAKTILTLAAGLEWEERTRLVEAQFPEEPALCGEVLSMLESYDKIKRVLGSERTSGQSAPEAARPVASSADATIQVGGDYGPYRVLRPLGAGGMGQVFLAEDVRLQRRVALKCVAGTWIASPVARQRLLREARAAAALSHAHIATLYDVLEDKNYFLLVMEYVEGSTIADFVAEGPISLGHAARLTIQICDALVYAHDRGILHCDLKPSNVQVSPDGSAKVLDLGLAHAKYDCYEFDPNSPASEGLLIGTPSYMPPERLLTGVLNVSGDIYSLGVTLFEMVTGRRPFVETDLATLTAAILGTTAPRASSIVPACPARLDDVIARAIAKDPKERYQTARELSRDLQEVLGVLDAEGAASTLAPLRAHSLAQLSLFVILAAIVGLTLTGFVTSTFYASPLGLTMDFDGESPIWWPVWGLRSLVVPLAQIAGILLAVGVASQLWRIALAAFTLLRRCREDIRKSKFVGWLRSTPTPALASGLLIAQVVALRLFWWRFEELIESFSNFFLQAGSLSALGPDHAGEHQWYMRLLSILVLVFAWSWYRLLKPKSTTRESPGPIVWMAGSVVMVMTFLSMVAPYRLFSQSDGERVSYESQSCFLVGQRQNEGRLFCPLQDPPWNRSVNLNDPGLTRSGTIENIFLAPR